MDETQLKAHLKKVDKWCKAAPKAYRKALKGWNKEYFRFLRRLMGLND